MVLASPAAVDDEASATEVILTDEAFVNHRVRFFLSMLSLLFAGLLAVQAIRTALSANDPAMPTIEHGRTANTHIPR